MTAEMTKVLNSDQRRFLDAQTQRAREAAQRAAEDALRALAVAEPSRPGYLSDEQNKLRLVLRDKARQLGDDTARAGAPLTNLVHDVAYEQWHRLLFARFLEVNGLLRHPDYRDIPLSLEDCGDLASSLREPDAWAVAARFAAEILPGVFGLTDPAVRVRFAAEHRSALERLLLDIPSEVFTTEDALGWVYQFWQTAEKKRVNESGVKIGGADLSPVTQLFTENYMVRFLLENSLGAWWAARHPESALLDGWEYLRRNEDGTPAAGSFSDWPEHAADVTVMDPCCGSGHFLVAMFGMLWRMRAEEEGLTPAEAQDAVLRDNLHGLELDPRCTQIATFNVALEAWKQGGFRELPAPQIACSGVPVRVELSEWESLAGSDSEVRKYLRRLHGQFRHADTFGSLIDPRPADGSDGELFGVDLVVGVAPGAVREVLAGAVSAEPSGSLVLGNVVNDVAQATTLLSRRYWLVATNPPFLGYDKMSDRLAEFTLAQYDEGSRNLATAFLLRAGRMCFPGGAAAFVTPDNWRFLATYRGLRKRVSSVFTPRLIASMGSKAFSTPMWDFPIGLYVMMREALPSCQDVPFVSAIAGTPDLSDQSLRASERSWVKIADQSQGWIPAVAADGVELDAIGQWYEGTKPGQTVRATRFHWEVPGSIARGDGESRWTKLSSSPDGTGPYRGNSEVIFKQSFLDAQIPESNNSGLAARGRSGLLLQKAGALHPALYVGEVFDNNTFVFIPHDDSDIRPLYAFMASGEFAEQCRGMNQKLDVSIRTVGRVRFDRDRWREVAAENRAPFRPGSNDPSQWLFQGVIPGSSAPLQVAVARALGYVWPDQIPDELDRFADGDGIAALVSLPGEPDLATRLRELLAAAYGNEWSSTLERMLVVDAGGKNGRLEDWLRDSFFAEHTKIFRNRPFLWHIWDGRKDGFSAIVNYHELDRQKLEKLTYTSLGAWIERQKHEASAERAGADARLVAAEDLQRRLRLILEGAPPYDIYVRWKPLAEQPIGWQPDLDDGVRLNIRPFVTAGVLRMKLNSRIKWGPDRGKLNDLHPTLEERRAARRGAEAAE
ncbi:MAG: SAM-dependent DNA methyltransferase [Acidimicrobiia bacterium]